ncbi:MAG: hypothetical protein ACTS5Y_01265, partial [Pollutimonas bauzanensis]
SQTASKENSPWHTLSFFSGASKTSNANRDHYLYRPQPQQMTIVKLAKKLLAGWMWGLDMGRHAHANSARADGESGMAGRATHRDLPNKE